MAHFYGSMQGSRGEATRCGTKGSGMSAHVRSWTHGIEACIGSDANGNDRVYLSVTSGSNGRTSQMIRIDADEMDSILRGEYRLGIVKDDE